MLYIGLDDTDTLGTPGTGRLARDMATLLAGKYAIGGIVRQQLFYDPRVPFTKNNRALASSLRTARRRTSRPSQSACGRSCANISSRAATPACA